MDRFLEVAVERDAMPDPNVPLGKELLDVADGFGAQLAALSPRHEPFMGKKSPVM